MELIHTTQLFNQPLQNVDVDIFMTSSGYEERCTFLLNKIDLINIPVKVLLAFKERCNNKQRKINDILFNNAGFKAVLSSGNDPCAIYAELSRIFMEFSKDELCILIDYSSMTKKWYASVLEFVLNNDLHFKKINLLFSYTPSAFSEPTKRIGFKYLAPVLHKERVVNASKPIALIVGLGYEPGKADFILKSLKPSNLHCLYPDNGIDELYTQTLLQNNSKIFEKYSIDSVASYPILNLEELQLMLTRLCLNLRLNYRVIIASTGPKPFSLISLFIAMKYPDIEIWSTSAGKKEFAYKRSPIGEPLILKSVFENVEDSF